jgi:hypothetical protein
LENISHAVQNLQEPIFFTMNDPSYTFRDRIKSACVSACVERGMDTDAMLELFTRRTAELKTGTWAGALSKGALGTAALGAIPLALTFAGSAGVGNLLGKQVADTFHAGDLPSKGELNDFDLAVTYERETEEIKRRMALNKRRREEQGKPSVRKLF